MLIIKVGGGKKINWDHIAEDLQRIIKREPVVLVHGANAVRDDIANKMGHPTKTIMSPSGVSSVYTDKKAMDIFLMAYAGLANKRIVSLLQKKGINAVGLSGMDAGLWRGKQKKNVYSVENGKTKLIADNLTGSVDKINTDIVKLLVDNNYVPVICPPAISTDGNPINTDGDLAAVKMASELGVKKIIFLFEMPGLLKRYPDVKTLLTKIDKNKIDSYLPLAEGRMKKKILAVKKAFDLGIISVYFGDGRSKNPVNNALLGRGTVIS